MCVLEYREKEIKCKRNIRGSFEPILSLEETLKINRFTY